MVDSGATMFSGQGTAYDRMKHSRQGRRPTLVFSLAVIGAGVVGLSCNSMRMDSLYGVFNDQGRGLQTVQHALN